MLHLSDLHLGKRLCGVSLLAEQREVLAQILSVTETESVDAVLIAGDVYDKLVPPAEAVRLFDWFLTELAARDVPVLLISGNHDSAERLAFGAALLQRGGVYVSPVYDGTVRRVTLGDGLVDVYLLPFLRPALVRPYHPEVDSYPAAMEAALAGLPLDPARRNVLLAHQFVAGSAPSESEERTVGGLDEIPAQCFAGFDYVALGHLHRAQSVGAETVRYCGSPLQYAFSEGEKSLTLVELEPDTVSVRTLPLMPSRPLRTLRGEFAALMAGASTDAYLRVILTDERELPDAAARLRTVYPNLLRLEYDNARTRSRQTLELRARTEELSPAALFEEFYRLQNGCGLSSDQSAYIAKLMEELP